MTSFLYLTMLIKFFPPFCKSSANEHSSFNRKNFSYVLSTCLLSVTPNIHLPLKKPTSGVPIMEVGNVYRWLTQAMVHPS